VSEPRLGTVRVPLRTHLQVFTATPGLPPPAAQKGAGGELGRFIERPTGDVRGVRAEDQQGDFEKTVPPTSQLERQTLRTFRLRLPLPLLPQGNNTN
jgi:hypothetical protein